MLVLLRIIFGGALAAAFALAIQASDRNVAGDVTPGFYLSVCLILGLANAIVWAPWVGEKLAAPLDTMYTGAGSPMPTNTWLRFAHWCAAKGHRRLAVLLAFAEGVRHPDLPGAFIVGLHNAKPGSWLEKIFAREVYRFHNVQNAVHAWEVLRRHGIEPPPHPNKEVNATLLSLMHRHQPESRVLPVPEAPEPPLKRNPRIQLFTDAAKDAVPETPAAPAEPPEKSPPSAS
jgi:hypothetical protein